MGAQASTQEEGTGELDKTIPVLAGPSKDAPVIGRIPAGEQAKLLTDNGNFMRVSWGGDDLNGWVDRRSINLEEEAAKAAVEAVRQRHERLLGEQTVLHSYPPVMPEPFGKSQSISRGAIQPALLAAAWAAPPEARMAGVESTRGAATPQQPLKQAVLRHAGGHPVVPVFAAPHVGSVAVGEVPNGQPLELLAERGEHVQVRWNHVQGWMDAVHVAERSAPQAVSMVCMMPPAVVQTPPAAPAVAQRPRAAPAVAQAPRAVAAPAPVPAPVPTPAPAPAEPQGPTLNQLNTCTTLEQSNARKEAMERATVPELPNEIAAMFSRLSTLPGGASRVPAF